MRQRQQGTIGIRPSEPTGELYIQAKQLLKAKADRLAADRARKAAIPVPNWKCYPMVFIIGKNIDHNGNWLGHGRVPKCRVCEENLYPKDNHECEGFKPKFMEIDDNWLELQESKRELIRGSKDRTITCSGCGEVVMDEDDARYHAEYCQDENGQEPVMVREPYAVNGDEDDLSGYEDEPEYDYCEGDDDGYDCD